MASEEKVLELEKSLETITKFSKKDLIRRQEWRAITFDIARGDIENILSVATDLTESKLRLLADSAIDNINASIPGVVACLEAIDQFNIESGSSAQDRDNIATGLRSYAEAFILHSSQWIPYLAYKRGDLSASVDKIEQQVNHSRQLLEKTEVYALEWQKKIDQIFEAAREASARGGVGIFTRTFEHEAYTLDMSSEKWLKTVVLMTLLTTCLAIGFFFWPAISDDATSWVTLRHVVAKVSVIALFFTGTVWCGRIYRALMHQSAVNRHRALSLQTFQAFVEATDDPITRDAVLMAATRSIFSNVPTGLVDERPNNQDPVIQFMDIGKTVGKATPTSQNISQPQV